MPAPESMAGTVNERGETVCGLYSSVVLVSGERAEVVGAGLDSVSMRISGPSGAWIFYDGLVPSGDLAIGGAEVLRRNDRIVYRRAFDPRVYAVDPVPARAVGDRFIEAAAMGIDLAGQPLDRPAIHGDHGDLAVVARVQPATGAGCDLRWEPGRGLVALRARVKR